MSDKVLLKSTNKQISLNQAIKKHGLIKDIKKFTIPDGKVVVNYKSKYQLMTKREAQTLAGRGELKLRNIYGEFNLDDGKATLKKPTAVPKRQEKKIQQLQGFVRRQLSNEDKLSKYAFHKFIVDNNLKGQNGKFVVMRNNRIIFEKDNISIPPSQLYNKWWADTGFLIGIQDSTYHIWSTLDRVVKNQANKRKKFVQLFYIGKNVPDMPKKLKSNKEKEEWTKKEILKETTIFYWIPDRTIKSKNILQTYRQNDNNNCFWIPIIDFIKTKIEEVKNNKRWISKLNLVNELKEKFKNGVPHTSIQSICDALNINFEITDIFGRQKEHFKNKGGIKYTIKFLNSRLNHVDINKYVDNRNNEEELNLEDMKSLMVELFNKNEWFYYIGTTENPLVIFTQEKTYKIYNEENEIIKEFNKEIKINDFKIDIMKDYEKHYFLSNGVNYRSHCGFSKLKNMDTEEINNSGEYFEYDLKKAYTQYKKSKYYVGFPNMMNPPIKLNDWTIEKCKKYIGYYCVIIKDIKNKNTKKILDELGLKIGLSYIFTTPELLLFNDFNVEFDILSGSFSYKPYDFDISNELMENKLYAKWAGKLHSHHTQTVYKVACEKKMAQILANKYNTTTNSYFNKKKDEKTGQVNIINEEINEKLVECKIAFENKEVHWLGHIGGYITAYTRCNVLSELLKIEHHRIIGYKLDGFIIHKKCDIRLYDEETAPNEIWAIKSVKCEFNWAEKIFCCINDIVQNNNEEDDYCNEIDYILETPKRYLGKTINDEYYDIYEQYVLLSGQGGTGKTHYTLSCLPDCLYVAGMWRLICEKMNDYQVGGLSIHQLIGENCESYLTTHKPPARVIIDEVNMIDHEWIERVIELLPYSQIILCGDVEFENNTTNYYQCSLKDVKIYDNFQKFQIKQFTKNYRCKDDELLNRLINLRNKMKESDFDVNEITKYVRKEFKDRQITEEELIKKYNYKTDWVLCSTTDEENCKTIPQTKYYTELLKGKKYLCVKHNSHDIYKKLNGEKICLRGEIITDINNTTKKYEQRDAFTIHSFQGLTIKNGNLYVDTNRIFCPRQLYTALSRVEYLNQIFIL